MSDHDLSLEDRIRAIVAAALAATRNCELCGADLSEPGTAGPIPPAAREGPDPEWQCLDERGCDLRATAKLRGYPGPLGYALECMADITAPARLELTA